jgi:hypothetical protein
MTEREERIVEEGERYTVPQTYNWFTSDGSSYRNYYTNYLGDVFWNYGGSNESEYNDNWRICDSCYNEQGCTNSIFAFYDADDDLIATHEMATAANGREYIKASDGFKKVSNGENVTYPIRQGPFPCYSKLTLAGIENLESSPDGPLGCARLPLFNGTYNCDHTVPWTTATHFPFYGGIGGIPFPICNPNFAYVLGFLGFSTYRESIADLNYDVYAEFSLYGPRHGSFFTAGTIIWRKKIGVMFDISNPERVFRQLDGRGFSISLDDSNWIGESHGLVFNNLRGSYNWENFSATIEPIGEDADIYTGAKDKAVDSSQVYLFYNCPNTRSFSWCWESERTLTDYCQNIEVNNSPISNTLEITFSGISFDNGENLVDSEVLNTTFQLRYARKQFYVDTWEPYIDYPIGYNTNAGAHVWTLNVDSNGATLPFDHYPIKMDCACPQDSSCINDIYFSFEKDEEEDNYVAVVKFVHPIYGVVATFSKIIQSDTEELPRLACDGLTLSGFDLVEQVDYEDSEWQHYDFSSASINVQFEPYSNLNTTFLEDGFPWNTDIYYSHYYGYYQYWDRLMVEEPPRYITVSMPNFEFTPYTTYKITEVNDEYCYKPYLVEGCSADVGRTYILDSCFEYGDDPEDSHLRHARYWQYIGSQLNSGFTETLMDYNPCPEYGGRQLGRCADARGGCQFRDGPFGIVVSLTWRSVPLFDGEDIVFGKSYCNDAPERYALSCSNATYRIICKIYGLKGQNRHITDPVPGGRCQCRADDDDPCFIFYKDIGCIHRGSTHQLTLPTGHAICPYNAPGTLNSCSYYCRTQPGWSMNGPVTVTF